jgi:hypothetical protein
MEEVERPFGRIIVPKNINLGSLRASTTANIAAQTIYDKTNVFIIKIPEVATPTQE